MNFWQTTFKESIGLIAMSGLMLPLSPARADGVEAVWRTQSLTFDYVSRNFMYACESLPGKVVLVLHAVGARNIRIEQAHCDANSAGNGPMQIATMRIQFASPALSTPAQRAEAERDAARARLLERFGLASAMTTAFHATFRDVDLGADQRLKLAASDCDLMRALKRRVISRMAVQVIAQEVSCSSSPQRLRGLRFKARVLAPFDAAAFAPG
jgi:hypothetical protein